MNHFSLAYFLGALCFFLYGMHLTEDGLRSALGDRLRIQVNRITKRRFSAFSLGILMTFIFQSSTATTIMLIGLTNIGVISVRHAVPVVLGADVGTTFLTFLLASFVRFNVLSFSLVLLVVGFLSTFLFRNHSLRPYAQAFLGFGFVFYGLGLIPSANEPLRQSHLFAQVVTAIGNNPPVAVLFTALFTGLIQSSAAVIGIIASFAAVGLINPESVLLFVLGANLGSTVGPFMASLAAQTDGKRLAYVHVVLKFIGAILILPFSNDLGKIISNLVEIPSYQVVAAHVGFNIALAVVFLPLTSIISSLATKWVKCDKGDKAFGPKYLDSHALDSPALAFANVHREILRMAEIVQEMCTHVLVPFEEVGRETLEHLDELDDHVDHLDRDIKFYLAKINQAQLTPSQGRRQQELMMMTHDIESIGDVISKDLVILAEKKRRKNVSFSQDGWKEINGFHRVVVENFQLAVTVLASGDLELGKKVLRHKKHLGEIEQELAQKHLMRLHQGLRESFDTSSIHLDILSNLRRINSIVCKLAYPILDRREHSVLT